MTGVSMHLRLVENVEVIIPTQSFATHDLQLTRALESVEVQTVCPARVYSLPYKSDIQEKLNKALLNSQFEFIALLNSTDILLPEHLNTLLTVARSTSADIVYSGSTILNESGEEIPSDERLLSLDTEVQREMIREGRIIDGAMFRTSTLRYFDGFSGSLSETIQKLYDAEMVVVPTGEDTYIRVQQEL